MSRALDSVPPAKGAEEDPVFDAYVAGALVSNTVAGLAPSGTVRSLAAFTPRTSWTLVAPWSAPLPRKVEGSGAARPPWPVDAPRSAPVLELDMSAIAPLSGARAFVLDEPVGSGMGEDVGAWPESGADLDFEGSILDSEAEVDENTVGAGANVVVVFSIVSDGPSATGGSEALGVDDAFSDALVEENTVDEGAKVVLEADPGETNRTSRVAAESVVEPPVLLPTA